MTTLSDIAGIQARIYHLSNHPAVMLATDLADVYGSNVKAINQAVKRNPIRFPERYTFLLGEADLLHLRSQNVTANPVSAKVRYEPRVFTHGGANMLSGVLKSPVADAMAVAINDAFTEMEQGAIEDAAHMVGKLRTDILAKKPIYVRIKDASDRGVHINTLWRETNYPKHKLETAVREMVRMAIIPAPLQGMQRELF